MGNLYCAPAPKEVSRVRFRGLCLLVKFTARPARGHNKLSLWLHILLYPTKSGPYILRAELIEIQQVPEIENDCLITVDGKAAGSQPSWVTLAALTSHNSRREVALTVLTPASATSKRLQHSL